MISYFELLKKVEEGDIPEKIKVHLTPRTSRIYTADYDGSSFSHYFIDGDTDEEYHHYLAECFLESDMFDKNIEILDEKKIEKLYTYRCYTDFIYHDEEKDDKERFLKDLQNTFVDIEEKINEIIDELNKLKDDSK